jgi:hypothetical protein
MIKCPNCQFNNEDGALFCEQCSTDLGGVASISAVAAAPPVATPVATPVAEVAAPLATPVIAEAAVAEAVPMAHIDAAPPPGAAVAVAVPMPEPPLASPAAETKPDLAGTPPTMSGSPPTMQPDAAAQTMHPATPLSQGPAAVPAAATPLPAGAQPKLVVLRGLKINTEYPLYEGHNFIGRADEKPVDIDLEDQEPPDRIWSSRQHALITFEDGMLYIEDLNSSNGTFVNRTRVYPGQKRPLNLNDVIQIGTVQMKVRA